MEYILTGKKTAIKVVFKYDLRGLLTSFEVEGVSDENQLRYLFWNAGFPFPYMEKMIPEIEKLGAFHIKIIEDDLSFAHFWDKYNYKVSRKKAEKLWEKLTKAEKIKVFLHLPVYERYLTGRSIEKAYPDTYLRNKRFEDEY